MRAHRTVRRAVRSILGTGTGLRVLRAASPDVVAVFLWHSVGGDAPPFFDRAGLDSCASSHCSIEAFDSHIRWIAQRFRIVPLDEAVAAARSDARGCGWLAALTFDDGFRNVATRAVPHLDARGYPSTIFVNADMAAQRWVKDSDVMNMGAAAEGKSREAIARETRAYATWDELRALPPSVSFGNHGARHLRLSEVTAEEARVEVTGGREAIARELGVERMPYAFAFGQPNDIPAAARRDAAAAHTCVLSAFGGFSWPGCAHQDVPRVPVFSSPDSALLTEYTFPPRFLIQRLRS